MSFKNALRKTWRETKHVSYIAKPLCLLINLRMQDKAHHSQAIRSIALLGKLDKALASFYLAELDFFSARYARALEEIEAFLSRYPSHIDGVILQSKILYLLCDKERAWRVLEDALQVSRRGKIWLALEKIVEDAAGFRRMERLFATSAQTPQTTIYLINAATKAGEYGSAKEYLKTLLLNNTQLFKARRYLNANDARVALRDLHHCFKRHNVNCFLISGTFLGCVREGRILSHDYDLDVGVFAEDLPANFSQCIAKEGVFCFPEFHTQGRLKLKHINGVLIDVFIHYKEGNRVYHAISKVRWYNTYFSLKEYWFLGEMYLGPSDAEVYLVENYGSDWRTPKALFDSVLDTPNAVIIHQEEFILHLYRLLMYRYGLQHKEKIIKMLEDDC